METKDLAAWLKDNPDLAAANAGLTQPRRSGASSVLPESSSLEAEFDLAWRAIDGPELLPEHVFHAERDWRFDRYHPGSKVAIEMEGGVWSNGRHVRPGGFIDDCEKYNAAAFMGIYVFRLPHIDVRVLEQIAEFIRWWES